METRAPQELLSQINTKIVMGIVGAAVLGLIICMVVVPRQPTAERDRVNTPVVLPVR